MLPGGLLAILLAFAWSLWVAHGALRAAVDFATVAYVGSVGCGDCHQDRHASWHRTYHRTMTQAATVESLRGHFDGRLLDAFGGAVRPQIEGGQALFEYRDPDTGELLARLPVGRTVGSHRYQQYLTRSEDSETWYRLHYLWHYAEQRWVHMNAAFLGSDAQPFDAQVTTWNANCVYCHNTGPRPRVQNLEALRARARAGEAVDVRAELRFDTEVAELGIGCEACHGPGGQHMERMDRPTLRWLARLAPSLDSSIVNPLRLPSARADDICAACHAGRTLPDQAALDRWLEHGPDFRPGGVLSEHVRLLDAATPSPSPHMPDLFRNRFWPDGTVRLTAYEQQGLRASACAEDPAMSCLRCHTMHAGDPAGMLPEAHRGDTPCLRCHQELRGEDAVARHSRHNAQSPGARCMNCHMPKAVYGVMEIHRSHHINLPDPAHDLSAGKPNACLNCHAEWSPRELQERWPEAAGVPLHRHDGAPIDLADGLVAVLAGDPVRKAVAADELGRSEQAADRAALLLRVPWLLAAMEDERPAIRRFAARSLAKLDSTLDTEGSSLALGPLLARFDYTGRIEQRRTVLDRLRWQFDTLDKSGWPAPPASSALDSAYRIDPTILTRLRELGQRSDKQIDIGE